MLITEAEVLAAVAPLVECCRRLHLPAVDGEGISMLRRYRVDEIVAARHYVNSRLTTDKVRSPMGLLIHTLKKGTVAPARPRQTGPQDAATSVEHCPAPLVVEFNDDEVNAYFDTHLRPDQNPLMAAREPSMSVKRALVGEHVHSRTS